MFILTFFYSLNYSDVTITNHWLIPFNYAIMNNSDLAYNQHIYALGQANPRKTYSPENPSTGDSLRCMFPLSLSKKYPRGLPRKLLPFGIHLGKQRWFPGDLLVNSRFSRDSPVILRVRVDYRCPSMSADRTPMENIRQRLKMNLRRKINLCFGRQSHNGTLN